MSDYSELAKRIEHLEMQLRLAVNSDSEYCKTVEADNAHLKICIAELEAENVKLREALKKIAAVEYGYQSLLDEYADMNAQNYHARKFWAETAARYKAVARAALEKNDGHN